jgi:DNA mismatch endonuclease (patch repair protein)
MTSRGSPDEAQPSPHRSRMQAVRRRDTAAEMLLRKALWNQGLRYRVHIRVAEAPPDIVFTRAKVAIFVDGCFWHGCPTHYVAPVNNAEFWRNRLASNEARDALRFWECEVRREIDSVVSQIASEVA